MLSHLRLRIDDYYASLINLIDIKVETILADEEVRENTERSRFFNKKREEFLSEIKHVEAINLKNLEILDLTGLDMENEEGVVQVIFDQNFAFIVDQETCCLGFYLVIVDRFIGEEKRKLLDHRNSPVRDKEYFSSLFNLNVRNEISPQVIEINNEERNIEERAEILKTTERELFSTRRVGFRNIQFESVKANALALFQHVPQFDFEYNRLGSEPSDLGQALRSVEQFQKAFAGQECSIAIDLKISKSDIKLIHSSLFSASFLNLGELNLSFSKIEEAYSFQCLVNLKALYLDNNELKVIDDITFSGLKNLCFLSLAFNYITTIDFSTFSCLPTLQILSLSSNHISCLHDYSFKGLKQLKTLWLDNNRLKVIKKKYFNDLISVQTIYLNNNRIEQINSNMFDSLLNLQWIGLSFNKIASIQPFSFRSLKSLLTLRLSCNHLIRLELNTFSGLVKLEKLYLNVNRIELGEHDAFNVFRDLANLKVLHLHDNKSCVLDRDKFSYVNELKF